MKYFSNFDCIYFPILIMPFFPTLSLRVTLVVCDSCGKRVLPLLDDVNIVCRAYPGATLESILPKLYELIDNYQPISCLIAVGVNDLTHLNRALRSVQPKMNDPFLLANSVIRKILSIRRRLLSHYPDLHVVFGGVNGIDLHRYNRIQGISPMQNVIDDCITQINCYIRLLNRQNRSYHPRLTSKVHTWRKGRRVNRYHLLSDGLHFGDVVAISWVWAIHRFHRRNTLGIIP